MGKTVEIPNVLDVPFGLKLDYPMLIVETGTNRQARTLIAIESGESFVLGRADIAGSDRSISNQHLIFNRLHDRYFVNGLHSKNNTLIRGTALAPDAPAVELQHGDHLKVGEIFLRVMLSYQ